MTTTHGKIAMQDWMTAPETVKVMAALHLDGGSARFVGGCVRDALANRKVLDIDIATPLKPPDVIDRLRRAKIRFAPTGLKHGTVTALSNGRPFEITTLRVDEISWGRHAEVKFTDDWEEDAARRDFTINAMSATLDGDVYDPFGGIKDLRAGRVVFVGDPEKRIAEDHLRILRFFRFYAHFGRGDPDSAALKACSAGAPLLTRLSGERIRQETLRLLESARAAEVWRIMVKHGVANRILPEATDAAALERLIATEEKYHDGAGVLRRLASLLVTTPEGMDLVADALRLSNAQREQVGRMVAGLIPAPVTAHDVRVLVYRLGNDMARSLLLLEAAKKGEPENFGELHDAATSFRPPRFPLEGGDVMKLGRNGPDIGRLLRKTEDWWLEQDFRPGRTECLERLKANAGSRKPEQ